MNPAGSPPGASPAPLGAPGTPSYHEASRVPDNERDPNPEEAPVYEDLADLKGTRIVVTFTDGTVLSIDSITPYESVREDIDATLGEEEFFRFLRVQEYLGYTHFIAINEIATVVLSPVVLIEGTVGKRPKPAKATKKKKTSPNTPAKKRKVSDG